MATKQRQLESALTYLAEAVQTGKYGRDNDIDEEAFREDFEELSEDVDIALED